MKAPPTNSLCCCTFCLNASTRKKKWILKDDFGVLCHKQRLIVYNNDLLKHASTFSVLQSRRKAQKVLCFPSSDPLTSTGYIKSGPLFYSQARSNPIRTILFAFRFSIRPHTFIYLLTWPNWFSSIETFFDRILSSVHISEINTNDFLYIQKNGQTRRQKRWQRKWQ